MLVRVVLLGGGWCSVYDVCDRGFCCCRANAFAGGIETSGRGDKGGLWAFEGADSGCGGEVGGAVGGSLSPILLQCFFLICWVGLGRGMCVCCSVCEQKLITGCSMCRRRVRLLKDLKSMQQMMLWCGRRRLLRKNGLRGGETHDVCNRAEFG